MSIGFGVGGAVSAMGMGLLSMKSVPDGAKLTGVPEMLTPGSPGRSVIPATMTFEGSAMSAWPATVTNSGLAEFESGSS